MLRTVLMLAFAMAAAAAPAPNEPPRPTAASVRQALGKSHLGREVRAIGRAMGEEPVIRYAYWFQEVPVGQDEELFFDLKWKSKGLALHFSRSNLHTAWMYNEKVEGYGCYVGELPEGLSFGDGLDAVEKKLGKPEASLRTPPKDDPVKKADVRIDRIYKKKGVCVSFRKPVGGEAAIIAVALFPSGDAPTW